MPKPSGASATNVGQRHAQAARWKAELAMTPGARARRPSHALSTAKHIAAPKQTPLARTHRRNA